MTDTSKTKEPTPLHSETYTAEEWKSVAIQIGNMFAAALEEIAGLRSTSASRRKHSVNRANRAADLLDGSNPISHHFRMEDRDLRFLVRRLRDEVSLAATLSGKPVPKEDKP